MFKLERGKGSLKDFHFLFHPESWGFCDIEDQMLRSVTLTTCYLRLIMCQELNTLLDVFHVTLTKNKSRPVSLSHDTRPECSQMMEMRLRGS